MRNGLRQQMTWISRCVVGRTSNKGNLEYYQLDIATNHDEQIQHHNKLHDFILQENFYLKSIEKSERINNSNLDTVSQYPHLTEESISKGFARSELTAINVLATPFENNRPQYLSISSQPLNCNASYDKPIWARPWINEPLKSLLFRSDINTYLLLDATTRTKVTGVFDLEIHDEIKQQSLYSGELANRFKKNAPYLLNISLSPQQLMDPDNIPQFHKDFFSNHWGQSTGLIVQSKSDLITLTRHFKKFIKIQNENKKWHYFRFTDPRVMNHYLQSITQWPQRVAK